MLKRSKSEGRTPNHLMSGVVRLLLSYDMFIEPARQLSLNVVRQQVATADIMLT